MKTYQQDALKMLDKFPETPEKNAMIELVNYVIDRKS
jgi:geranylgeranyl pyrophosphate synthase